MLRQVDPKDEKQRQELLEKLSEMAREMENERRKNTPQQRFPYPMIPRGGACPHCGYCPHCGRGGYNASPHVVWM